MQVGSYQAVGYSNQTCLGGRLYRATDKEVAGSYRVIAGNTAAAPGRYSGINDFTDTAANTCTALSIMQSPQYRSPIGRTNVSNKRQINVKKLILTVLFYTVVF